MKKLMITLCLLISFVFIGTGKVNAIGDVSIITSNPSSTLESSTEIKIQGDILDNKSYYVKFMKDEDSSVPTIPSNSTMVEKGMKSDGEMDLTKWFVASGTDKRTINIYDSFQMYNGYNGAYILECDISSCTMSDRVSYSHRQLPKLGTRYRMYLMNNKIKIYSLYSKGTLEYDDMVEIGKITSEEIINKYKKNSSDVYESLLEYAKNNEPQKTYTVPNDGNDGVSIENFNVEPCTFYYIYITNDTNNGKYKKVEDVSFAMGFNTPDGETVLTNSDVVNELESCGYNINSSSSSKVSNPKTYDIKLYALLIGLVVTLVLIGVGTKKIIKIKNK